MYRTWHQTLSRMFSAQTVDVRDVTQDADNSRMWLESVSCWGRRFGAGMRRRFITGASCVRNVRGGWGTACADRNTPDGPHCDAASFREWLPTFRRVAVLLCPWKWRDCVGRGRLVTPALRPQRRNVRFSAVKSPKPVPWPSSAHHVVLLFDSSAVRSHTSVEDRQSLS